MTNSGAIPEEWHRNPVIPADSGAIPPESGHSCRNAWGTIKYTVKSSILIAALFFKMII